MPHRKGNIPLKAHILLGPLGKYMMYGVFPWSLLLHVILVLVDVFLLYEFNKIIGGQAQH